jgi:hypothetical protein
LPRTWLKGMTSVGESRSHCSNLLSICHMHATTGSSDCLACLKPRRMSFLDPRWGSLAENHSPESKGFRRMTKGEEPIQLYINIYMISSAPCFQPFSHFYLIS